MKNQLFVLLIVVSLLLTPAALGLAQVPLGSPDEPPALRPAARLPQGAAAQPWFAPERSGPGSVITVNTVDDELNSDGDCSLREAIEAANLNGPVDACVAGSGDDTVVVPGGTYVLALAGAGEDGNQTGDLDILDNLTLTGAGAKDTILDGNGLDRVVQIQIGRTAEINALTVTGGLVTDFNGGGISNLGTLTLNDAILRGNTVASSEYWGGALGNDALVQSATATVNRSLIMDNAGVLGGGLANTAMSFLTATLHIDQTIISDNSASVAAGGLYNGSYDIAEGSLSVVSVTDSVFTGNATLGQGTGGGVFTLGWWSWDCFAELTLERVTIHANTADASPSFPGRGEGAGLFASNSTTLVRDSIISNNSASGVQAGSGRGGGVYIWDSPVTISNSTVSGNQIVGEGGWGGGIAIETEETASSLALINVTLSGNSASGGGGAIASSNRGAGVPDLTLKNTLINGNSAPQSASCFSPDWGFGPANFSSLGNNLEDWNLCNLDQPSDLPDADAHLEPLADNGGPTWTHALPGNSPAVDMGECAGFDADQRGQLRPVDVSTIANTTGGDGCDIGAYEAQFGLVLTKTVGLDSSECAATSTIALDSEGGVVYYCYQIENTGAFTFTLHELWDDPLGPIFDGSYNLEPGIVWWMTDTAYITQTTVNTATWTAYNPGPADVITATNIATVTVPSHPTYRIYVPLISR